VLIEIAKRRRNYLPDLSFGTFLPRPGRSADKYCLYIPMTRRLYSMKSFWEKQNILPEILPEYENCRMS
jgi:hypothetical protein